MPSKTSAEPRSRRARNSLTVDAILNAAEQVAAAGFEALTVRAVAVALEAAPMSLYRYFCTKDGLVDALLNRVLGRFIAPQETAEWPADLAAFARNHRQLLRDHPWAVTPLIGHPYPGPNALPIGEAALRILERAGITGDAAVAVFSGIVALNYGWSSFVLAREATEQASGGGAVQLPHAPPEFPLTAAVAGPMNRYGSEDHYERTLKQLLAGIEADSRNPVL
ncbi:TetR/AcrR family transcriptional regulator [Arthrobacter sp. ISL-69]|uniref:TetR/AcrR family transcriptional regulator n=1 Tax=Arthrobacter sp. ISL-69 TaxID=2819113 RepID=UPI001BECD514|nr:TetR/AcrR family transcriptional regulator [Arthrobacter sp. ISL-69]MBT2538284.1 TetR/AcrR family transcriptional regulator C-terminal domain-containing protein [Arthrobacter sp. ISL-69]